MKRNNNKYSLQEFIRYLKDNELYTKFRANYHQFDSKKTNVGDCGVWSINRKAIFDAKSNKKYPLATYIHFGFIWCYANEDEEFWAKIQTELEQRDNVFWTDF